MDRDELVSFRLCFFSPEPLLDALNHHSQLMHLLSLLGRASTSIKRLAYIPKSSFSQILIKLEIS